MSASRRFDLEFVGDAAVATLLDARLVEEADLDDWGRRLYAMIEGDQLPNLVLDFSNVEQCSSSALGKLVVLQRKALAMGARLRVCNVRPEIFEVLAITQLTKILDVKDSLDSALASLR